MTFGWNRRAISLVNTSLLHLIMSPVLMVWCGVGVMQPKSRPPPSFIFSLHLGESAVLRRHNGPILSGKWSRHHVSIKITNLLTTVTADKL